MKKWMSLLLVAAMLLSLCACAKGGTEGDGKDTGPSTSGNETIPPEEILTEITLPLCEEKQELSVWLIWTNSKNADPNSLEGVQYLEELTNVHINWITVTAEEAGEKFQLLQASTNLPDIILPYSTSVTTDQAIGDGWAIDMSDLIARYMPNYRAYLETHELERRVISGTDGVVRCASNVAGNDDGFKGEEQWAGLAVRTDLIEKAGYTGPLETIEDYHQMLLTCKQNLEGLDAPLYVGPGGYGINGAFLSAYGVTNGVMVNDGTVVYGPTQDGYGQWLAEMRKWYSEGLIDPNFETVSGLDIYWAPAGMVGTNKTVCFTTLYNNIGTLMPMILGNITDPTAVITGVVNPVLNRGDQPMLINVGTGSGGASQTGNVYISADCKNPELAAKWLDFMLTEQAMVAGQYGREGVHYDLDTSEGAPYKYVFREGYQTEDERLAKIGCPGIGYYNWSVGTQAADAQMAGLSAMYAAQGLVLPDNYQMLLDTKALWDSQGYIDNALTAALTTDESAQIATIKTDIDTRIAEYTIQYIKGQTDETFEEFRQELENMQVQAVVDVYQVAYDRFMAK